MTRADVEMAVASYLSWGGPEASPLLDVELKWQVWLSELNSSDAPMIAELCIEHVDRLDGFLLSDPWLITLLRCLVAATIYDPGTFLKLAARYEKSPRYRCIFLSTGGELRADTVTQWLRRVTASNVSEEELRLITHSLYDASSEVALDVLDSVIRQLPSGSPLRGEMEAVKERLARIVTP